ncbi:tetratricopeptide repeat protein [uncultured Hyphomonas sp.]|uniref:tetratricopeptide repeat protein n=1 Tax=uncultured Hyphomonas sp. TaxID=225298 RepID=UPI002AAB2D7F|nr:tetratricopeptide repeat protein [uncultured Hyphomonas sp.]
MMKSKLFDARTSRLGALAGLLTLLAAPAAAGPAGTYVRTMEGGRPAAERCAAAAAHAGHAAADGIAICTKAIEAAGASVETKAASLTNRALLFRSAGDLDAALEDCGGALALVPDHPGTAVTCSAVYINAGKPDAAIGLLEGAPLPAPGVRYRYYHNLALAHHDLGQYALAYDFLQKTLETNPGFTPAIELKKQYRVAGE